MATVDDARVGAPVADAAPPPSPAAAAAAVGRGKGKGKSKERAPGSVSNSEITARLMHPRATAAEVRGHGVGSIEACGYVYNKG